MLGLEFIHVSEKGPWYNALPLLTCWILFPVVMLTILSPFSLISKCFFLINLGKKIYKNRHDIEILV